MERPMKSINPILGLRVAGLDLKWAKRHDSSPASGLFLRFDDGSYYEFRATSGYLEMGRHLPPHHNSADARLANYQIAACGRLPSTEASTTTAEPVPH
jgi:hypothetical protein